jgi:hypothetical protein
MVATTALKPVLAAGQITVAIIHPTNTTGKGSVKPVFRRLSLTAIGAFSALSVSPESLILVQAI